MPKPNAIDAELLDRKLNALHEQLEKVEQLEERMDELLERKLYEVRTLAYVLLLITGIQLALTIGALARQLAG